MIILYYILGISRTDTFYFSTEEDQRQFLNQYVVETIEDIYYPPHYHNLVKLDISNITFQDSINYLSIDFNGKIYYYFIDSIEYINQNVVNLSITMDTIQSYFFNIRCNNAVIERKLINRYNDDGTINRNYIRENLSTSSKFITKTDLNNEYWLLICAKNELGSYLEDSEELIVPTYVTKGYYNTGLYYYIKPLGTYVNELGYLKKDGTYGYFTNDSAVTFTMSHLIQNENILSIKLIPKVYFNQYKVGLDYNIPYGAKYYDANNDKFVIYAITSDIAFKDLELSLTIDNFVINNNKKESFNYLNIPYLLDDNYIQINFGETISKTQIQLQLLDKPLIKLKYGYDITTGSRYYQICNSVGVDIQESNLIVNSEETIGLLTNAWNEYYSRNVGSATMGVANKLLNTGFKSVTATNTTERVKALMGSGILDGITTAINLANTPNEQKVGNSANADVMSGNLNINYCIAKISDIELESVAKQIESRGYLVNETFSGNTDILTALQSRYYFNIIKTSDINLTLTNAISDNATLSNIKERFNNGFRYWTATNYSTEYGIQNLLKVDNVEI